MFSEKDNEIWRTIRRYEEEKKDVEQKLSWKMTNEMRKQLESVYKSVNHSLVRFYALSERQ